jgi:hypothetical protein
LFHIFLPYVSIRLSTYRSPLSDQLSPMPLQSKRPICSDSVHIKQVWCVWLGCSTLQP